ncbi:hypothetical protein GCM10010293_12710 [Streptomyces griseoflavus]|nr:hypothetical protein GCM10010293_12710 [Streptomyces griseoflavus]
MSMAVPVAYKGLEVMPTWFVGVLAVPAAVGIVLAWWRRR